MGRTTRAGGQHGSRGFELEQHNGQTEPNGYEDLYLTIAEYKFSSSQDTFSLIESRLGQKKNKFRRIEIMQRACSSLNGMKLEIDSTRNAGKSTICGYKFNFNKEVKQKKGCLIHSNTKRTKEAVIRLENKASEN